MYRLVIVVLPLLYVLSQRLAGQDKGSNYQVLSGRIVDDSLGNVLPFVHLWNERSRLGGISNDSGEFSMKVRSQDTVVFSALGYFSDVFVVSGSSFNQHVVVRLKPKIYEIAEVVVRRFGSYESFKYQVIHLDLPEAKTAELRKYINVISTAAALEADRERAVKDKLSGFGSGFGYITPLGRGINPEQALKEKISNQIKREQVINAKFNRVLVGDITQLGGEELTDFIAFCNFSEDYLYETDLYTIVEALYAKINDYQKVKDTIHSANEQ